MNFYKALVKQIYINGDYKLVPIRHEDRIAIMQWRNEQIYHLRQSKPLTIQDQDNYFDNVVTQLFEQDQPSELLFSFLKDDVCIGYGGLVHINWVDKNAEISFIMDTKLEQTSFNDLWSVYLELIEQIGFEELRFRKLYVYAFDLRPHLYDTLSSNNYFRDAVLAQHCLYKDKFIDVVIHAKLNS